MKSVFRQLPPLYVAWLFGILAVVKTGWVIAETGWLTFGDIDYIPPAKKEALFYRSNFASGAPPVTKPVPVAPVRGDTIKDLELLLVYHAVGVDVVTVRYKGRTYVLSVGDNVGAFTFVSAGENYAVFERDGRRYTLTLKDFKRRTRIARNTSLDVSRYVPSSVKAVEQADEEIIFDGKRRIIPRETLEKYTKNLKNVYKNIGLTEVRNGSRINGFKVTFIRRGSIFSKLGLQRGDILLSIDGKPLDSYKAAFDAYRNVNGATSTTLQIKRGNTTMELQYEID